MQSFSSDSSPSPGAFWIMLGALLAGIGVALGAFGAHALKATVPPDLLTVYETGSRYHLLHAQALILVGILASRLSPRSIRVAGWAFTLGILLFSFSLYTLAITGIRKLGMVTPLGGVAFMVGWASLAVGGWTQWRGSRNIE